MASVWAEDFPNQQTSVLQPKRVKYRHEETSSIPQRASALRPDRRRRAPPGRSSRPSERPKLTEKSKTPVLDNFGRDRTTMAGENKLHPIAGPQPTIERKRTAARRRNARVERAWRG